MTSRQFYIYTCICFCFTTQSNASSTNHCEIDPGISNLANKNQLLMFGELHGTNEMPKYFADVVCSLSTKNRPIKVGIEHPSAQLPLLEQYINSAGTEEDRLALINNSYWASKHQDGRTSQAMFDLVDRVRQMRELGKDVRVFVFDDQTTTDREQAMANKVIAELKKNPEVLHVLLTGNIHSRTMAGTPWNEKYKPMGLYVAESQPNLVSIVFTHSGGDAWLCTPDCKKTNFKLKATAGINHALKPAAKKTKHQYQIEVGVIAVSYPVVR